MDYLRQLERIIPLKRLLDTEISESLTSEYYTKTARFYRRYHSPEGAMHFPLQEKGVDARHKEKLKGQLTHLSKIIRAENIERVLELGCGMGYNSRGLAVEFPDKHFLAMDLTPSNIAFAEEHSEDIKNVEFQEGNFNEGIAAAQQQLCFAIETLCHAHSITNTMSFIADSLEENGQLVVFDGLATPKMKEAPQKIQQMGQLFILGFAMNNLQQLNSLKSAAEQAGLVLVLEENLTEQVLPNFKSFQKGVLKLFRFPFLTKIALKTGVISLPLFRDSLAGLFGPVLIEKGYLGYYKLIFKKK